jgi:hypothetical protein
MLLESTETLFILDRPRGRCLRLDAGNFEAGLSGVAVNLVGEDAQSQRLVDRLIEAGE